MTITSIAVFTQSNANIEVLHSHTATRDIEEYNIALSAAKNSYAYGFFSFAPHLDENRISYLDIGYFKTYMFISTDVLQPQTAVNIINAIKYSINNHIPMANLIHKLENVLAQKYQASHNEKIKLVQQLLDETKNIALAQVNKLLERQDKIEHLLEKTNQLSEQTISFKTAAFKSKKPAGLFSFFSSNKKTIGAQSVVTNFSNSKLRSKNP